MGLSTVAGASSDNITVAVKSLGSTKSVTVDVPAGTYFALRLQGGGSLVPTGKDFNSTANCDVQVYNINAVGGKYLANIKGASDSGSLLVGYNAVGPTVPVRIQSVGNLIILAHLL
jgi:hypothetical protein